MWFASKCNSLFLDFLISKKLWKGKRNAVKEKHRLSYQRLEFKSHLFYLLTVWVKQIILLDFFLQKTINSFLKMVFNKWNKIALLICGTTQSLINVHLFFSVYVCLKITSCDIYCLVQGKLLGNKYIQEKILNCIEK